jgi:hypothetical protein
MVEIMTLWFELIDRNYDECYKKDKISNML